jgi:hypothetical protein
MIRLIGKCIVDVSIEQGESICSVDNPSPYYVHTIALISFKALENGNYLYPCMHKICYHACGIAVEDIHNLRLGTVDQVVMTSNAAQFIMSNGNNTTFTWDGSLIVVSHDMSINTETATNNHIPTPISSPIVIPFKSINWIDPGKPTISIGQSTRILDL